MNRFIIVDGLPYLYADGKAYAVKWDEKGFTVGAEVEMASVPDVTYSEISILAKCHDCLNSIDVPEPEEETPDLEEMTVNELKEYASENGIDIGAATKKADIIAVINAAAE